MSLRCALRALSTTVAKQPPAAVVIGGGVSGLTCAVRLLEAGFAVSVVAKERPEQTVSVGAGAIWEYPPFKVAPQEKAREWCAASRPAPPCSRTRSRTAAAGPPRRAAAAGACAASARQESLRMRVLRRALASRDVFEALPRATGVRLLRAHYLYAGAAPPERLAPPYAHLLRDFRSGVVPAEAAPAFVTGYSHVTPVVDMTLYLPFLERLVTALGGSFTWHTALPSLAAAAAASTRPAVVVNCAALGAAALCGDDALTPVRGIKVYVHAPFVESVYCAEPRDASPEFTTIIPRARGGIVACSGVAQPGATSLEVRDEEVAAVLRRCAALLPSLAGAPVVGTWAGLRPLRAAAAGGVRLESEPPAGGDAPTVIHNYGCALQQQQQQQQQQQHTGIG
jgi:D-amino-acid oxidase